MVNLSNFAGYIIILALINLIYDCNGFGSFKTVALGPNSRIRIRNNGRDYYYRDSDDITNLEADLVPLTPEEEEDNLDILSAVLDPPIQLRGQTQTCDANCLTCLQSCNHLKQAKSALASALVQYMYLVVCAKGCKNQLECLSDKYCLPIMRENPEYFIQCANSCPLFPIIPKVFVK